jgi:hypothetical protein
MGLRCTVCEGYFADNDPSLKDVVPGINQAGTCVCARCDAKRNRVPRPSEPTKPGFYWHRCKVGWVGEPEWHPVEVTSGNQGRLEMWHPGSEIDDYVDEDKGEWGPEIPRPVVKG